MGQTWITSLRVAGQRGSKVPQTTLVFAIDLGCPSQLDGKILPLRTPHILSSGCREISLEMIREALLDD